MLEMLKDLLPTAATEAARQWDHLFWFLIAVSVVFFLIVMVPLVVFVFKYRSRAGRRPTPIAHNDTLEILWTAIPTVILMGIFAWGWIVYKDLMMSAPSNSMEIKVMAQKWNWTFQYPDGRTTSNELFVPANTPVKLLITSKSSDVLHSFFVPNFRIKKDAVPGMYNVAWFNSNIVGQHIVFCAEYCGAGHSQMKAKVVVLDPERWELWQWGKEIKLPEWVGFGGMELAASSSTTASAGTETTGIMAQNSQIHADLMIKQGEKVFRSKGCIACHSAAGDSVGPSHQGLFESKVLLADGRQVVADENYIRESIENPMAKIRKGFENRVMPPYPGQLSDEEFDALVAYIKSNR